MELIAGGSLLVLILFYAVAFILALAFPIAFLVLLFRAVRLLERLVKLHEAAAQKVSSRSCDDSKYQPRLNQ